MSTETHRRGGGGAGGGTGGEEGKGGGIGELGRGRRAIDGEARGVQIKYVISYHDDDAALPRHHGKKQGGKKRLDPFTLSDFRSCVELYPPVQDEGQIVEPYVLSRRHTVSSGSCMPSKSYNDRGNSQRQHFATFSPPDKSSKETTAAKLLDFSRPTGPSLRCSSTLDKSPNTRLNKQPVLGSKLKTMLPTPSTVNENDKLDWLCKNIYAQDFESLNLPSKYNEKDFATVNTVRKSCNINDDDSWNLERAPTNSRSTWPQIRQQPDTEMLRDKTEKTPDSNNNFGACIFTVTGIHNPTRDNVNPSGKYSTRPTGTLAEVVGETEKRKPVDSHPQILSALERYSRRHAYVKERTVYAQTSRRVTSGGGGGGGGGGMSADTTRYLRKTSRPAKSVFRLEREILMSAAPVDVLQGNVKSSGVFQRDRQRQSAAETRSCGSPRDVAPPSRYQSVVKYSRDRRLGTSAGKSNGGRGATIKGAGLGPQSCTASELQKAAEKHNFSDFELQGRAAQQLSRAVVEQRSRKAEPFNYPRNSISNGSTLSPLDKTRQCDSVNLNNGGRSLAASAGNGKLAFGTFGKSAVGKIENSDENNRARITEQEVDEEDEEPKLSVAEIKMKLFGELASLSPVSDINKDDGHRSPHKVIQSRKPLPPPKPSHLKSKEASSLKEQQKCTGFNQSVLMKSFLAQKAIHSQTEKKEHVGKPTPVVPQQQQRAITWQSRKDFVSDFVSETRNTINNYEHSFPPVPSKPVSLATDDDDIGWIDDDDVLEDDFYAGNQSTGGSSDTFTPAMTVDDSCSVSEKSSTPIQRVACCVEDDDDDDDDADDDADEADEDADDNIQHRAGVSGVTGRQTQSHSGGEKRFNVRTRISNGIFRDSDERRKNSSDEGTSRTDSKTRFHDERNTRAVYCDDMTQASDRKICPPNDDRVAVSDVNIQSTSSYEKPRTAFGYEKTQKCQDIARDFNTRDYRASPSDARISASDFRMSDPGICGSNSGMSGDSRVTPCDFGLSKTSYYRLSDIDDRMRTFSPTLSDLTENTDVTSSIAFDDMVKENLRVSFSPQVATKPASDARGNWYRKWCVSGVRVPTEERSTQGVELREENVSRGYTHNNNARGVTMLESVSTARGEGFEGGVEATKTIDSGEWEQKRCSIKELVDAFEVMTVPFMRTGSFRKQDTLI